DTLRGTLEGVPALIDVLKRQGCRATFFFSVGPDNTGRALRRVFRRGFLSKVRRTSVLKHYGLRTLTYGLLLPGPRIARRAGHIMRHTRAEGFEIGVHAHDHVRWQDNVARRGREWANRELMRAHAGFTRAVGEPPQAHAAAGWQMNDATPWLEASMAFRYASDTRGHEPFLPAHQGTVASCPQLPTTLPTLDELIGLDGMTEADAADEILRLSAQPLPWGHVYTLHAELEGMALAPTFAGMLATWRARGYEILALADLHKQLDTGALPWHEITMCSVRGRAGLLACQGRLVQPRGA
ncbi:MAG: polysaccharide deacetylase family protein, partial [Steroidobacteraceae bacterium]